MKSESEVESNILKRFLKSYFGVRIVKTAFAATFAMIFARLIGLRMPTMAGFAALISMKASIFDSYKAVYNRLLSTIVGALIASLFQYIGFTGYFAMFIGITLIINICNFFNWKDSTTLASMVFVIVLIYHPSAPNYLTYWQYGVNRLLDTSVGLGIGFFVNYIIFPPNRSEFIINTYEKSLKECEMALLNILKGEKADLAALVSDIDTLNAELNSIRRDTKMGTRRYLKTRQLSKMNLQFYSAFGKIAQFSIDGRVPILSENNKQGLKKYFGDDLIVDTEIYPLEFETAFNYYLDDLLEQLTNLKNSVEGLKERLRNFDYIDEDE